jgi:hypothetical protein
MTSKKRLWSSAGLMIGAAVLLSPLSGVSEGADPAPRAAAASASSTALPADLQDPAFTRYVDLGLLRQAIEHNDAALATDVALQLLNGEEVLLREHRALSAAHAIQLASRIAGDTGDAASLQRLAKAARKTGDLALIGQIETLVKLGKTSRSAGPDLKVSVQNTSPDQLALFNSVVQQIDVAQRVGDGERLAKLEQFVKGLNDFPQDQKQHLLDRIAKAREKPETPSKASETLKKLTSASRGLPYGNYQTTYFDPNGNQVQAPAVLNGFTGNYYTPDGSVGNLYNITEGFPNFNPGVPVGSNNIFGNWQLGGSQGWFFWAMYNQGNGFQGSWGFTGGPMVNRWWGNRAWGGGGPVPVQGPVPFQGPAPFPGP